MSMSPDGGPVAAAPERGVATLCGVEVSRVDYFVEGEDHVFESTEFDVVAAGASFEQGFERFHHRLVEYALMLGELTDEELTENEREAARVLMPRLMKGYEAVEQHLDASSNRRPGRRIASAIRVLRGENEGSPWRVLSGPRTLPVPSHA